MFKSQYINNYLRDLAVKYDINGHVRIAFGTEIYTPSEFNFFFPTIEVINVVTHGAAVSARYRGIGDKLLYEMAQQEALHYINKREGAANAALVLRL